MAIRLGTPAERVGELLEHHQVRRQRCMDAVVSGASSGWDISRLVFPRATGFYDQRMALFETVAHLEALKVEGRLVEDVVDGRSHWLANVPAAVSSRV